MKWFKSRAQGEGEGSPGRREAFSESLAVAPRDTTWQVARGERVELRDQAGTLIAWTRGDRALSSLKDAAGRSVVSFRPGVKQMFSAGNIVQLGIEGAVFGSDGVRRPIGPSSVTGPPLDLQDMNGGITFAQVYPSEDPGPQVMLLPPGRINDRLLDRKLSPDDIARMRLRSPLAYTRGEGGVDQLRDPAGGVVARIHGRPGDAAGREDPQAVEVGDNDLPAAWLWAIVLGCRRWRG